jgi:hypothetical protein
MTVTMSGTAVLVLPHGREIVGAERVGEEIGEATRAALGVDLEIGAAVFEKHLPAPAARGQDVASGVADGDGPETASTLGEQVTDEYAFGTQTQSV